jgi:hypothetical protein
LLFFCFFSPNFFLNSLKRCSKMEQADGWLTVLEKNGLGPAAAILENYGIDSETDLLVLDQDDFSKLASRGLKPLYAKKLERWCGAVRERAENMLPSSLNTPPAEALLSSEALNVVTPAAQSVGAEDCGDMSRRVGSVMLAKFCSHSLVSKESLSPSIHIGRIGLVTCLRRG